jgi:hypothetical protein
MEKRGKNYSLGIIKAKHSKKKEKKNAKEMNRRPSPAGEKDRANLINETK